VPAPAIAFDVTPLQNAHRYRGIGTYVRGLARRLAVQTDVPIEFWGWQGGLPFDTPPPHRMVGLRRFPMPRYRGAWVFAQLAMKWRARGSGARIVHVTDPDALTPLRGRTLMATVYDLIPLKQPASRQRLVANAGYRSYLDALRRVDTLFAISQQTADDVVGLLHLPAGRILVARPGVDLPRSIERSARRDRPYFLYVGGPNPNKNLAVILEAMPMCRDLNEELLIAGHWLPKQVAALNTQLAADGLASRARHIGFVPDSELVDFMRGATALVIPSLHEGFGLPVAEGLAAGALVVHSDLPVLRETSAGAALVFAARSAADLASCLRQAASDPDLTDQLRRRGLERARELTWDAAVETTLAAYRAALSK
jgi:glycosyltransferase involved in cell wall biosynthesis